MTFDIFMSGVGVACCIFTTGLLLAMGWHAGIIAGAWCFGPHRTHSETHTTINLPSAAPGEGSKK